MGVAVRADDVQEVVAQVIGQVPDERRLQTFQSRGLKNGIKLHLSIEDTVSVRAGDAKLFG